MISTNQSKLDIKDGINVRALGTLDIGRAGALLSNSNINNSHMTFLGKERVSIKNYQGMAKSTIFTIWQGGYLDVSENFEVNNGIFIFDPTTSKSILALNDEMVLVNAKSIKLEGNNIFIYKGKTQYELVPIIEDGKLRVVVQKSKGLVIPTIKSDGTVVIPVLSSQEQEMVDLLEGIVKSNKGNKEFDFSYSALFVDRANSLYNVAQLLAISSTTKKEVNKTIANAFSNVIMDKSIDTYAFDEKLAHNRGIGEKPRKILLKQLDVWSSISGVSGSINSSSPVKNSKQVMNIFQGVVGIQVETKIGSTSGYHLGGAFGYSIIDSQTKNPSLGGDKRLKISGGSYNSSIYGGFRTGDGFYSNVSMNYQFIKNEYKRNVDIKLVFQDNKSKVNDQVISVINETGYVLGDKLQLTPFVTFSYFENLLQGYKEEGNGFAFESEKIKGSDVNLGVGARINANWGGFIPNLEVSYERKMNKDRELGEVTFIHAGGTKMIFKNQQYPRDSLKVKVGGTYMAKNGFGIGLNANYEGNKEILTFGSNIKVHYSF